MSFFGNRSRVGLTLSASLLSLIAAGPVFAQAAAPAPTPTPPAAEEADGTEIVVTGSRIVRRNLTSLEPTVTVSREYVDDRGITNIADALNEFPGFRSSVTPNGAQGSYGQGVNFVNGFGLGSNRTLTLVNGRRFVTSNTPSLFGGAAAGTQVDLNNIPTILIDRVDVVSIGGAPIYGSDAIAGTVNLILKNRYKGVMVQANSGVSGQGDNFRYNASILGGWDFAGGRGNITVSYSRDDVKGVGYNQRDFLRQNLGNVTNPTPAQATSLRGANFLAANDGRIDSSIGYNASATDGFPGTVVVRDRSIYYLTRGGLIDYAENAAGAQLLSNSSGGLKFGPDGNLSAFNTGIRFPSIYASGGDGFRFNDYSQITGDVRRNTFNALLSYDFSPALKFFAEGEYYNSYTNQLFTQPTFNSSLFSGTSYALLYDVNDPFLTPQAKAALVAAGVKTFEVSRASSDLADTSGYNKTDLFRGVGGFRGEFNVGSKRFNYEVSGTYGQTVINDFNQDLNAQRFINAVNYTTNGAGQVVCTTNATNAYGFTDQSGIAPVADSACVPLNLLGEGRASQAAKDYVISTNNAKSILTQWVINANIGGSPFKLFGNDVGFNVGYEHRDERGDFRPSAFEQQGLGRASAVSPVAGGYSTNEVFGEVNLPLVTDENGISFLNRVEVFGRGRYVDNTTNGGFFSWAAGGVIAPVRDLQFRGNFTRSFRSPAVTELFLPVSPSFDTVLDLCTPGAQIAGPVPATRTANCKAFLAKYPNATPLLAAGATVPSLSGGNPNLRNEVSDSYTFGVVVQPRWIRGLSLSADYVRINIKDPIVQLSVDDIVQACFDNPVFNANDPANGNAFCSLIKRDATGQVLNNPATPGVSSGFINGQRIFYEGIQGTLSYETSLSGLHIPGRLALDGNLTYTGKRVVDNTGVAPVRTDGTLGDPTFAGLLTVSYRGPTWGTNWSFSYTGDQLFSRVSRGADIREFDKLHAFVTINPSIYVAVGKQYRLNFSVTNLLDRSGQKFGDVIIPASYSDLIGRRFVASVQMRF
ncbi:TonB-dependent receptor [Sphingomonas sp. HMWF008]|nr:TonB-dependent receptor [Sphingomonas sp. HMWF008]